jgi:hypothetical protein
LAASFISTEKRLKVNAAIDPLALARPISSFMSKLKNFVRPVVDNFKWGSMPTHKFQIGQTAFLNPSNRHIPEGACVVTKKLPERDGEFEYRVKSANELHERVVRVN